jgi:tetratricopeptide (TPR) repeat protein
VKWTLWLIGLCMLGVASLGVILFPREHEIALMSFRDAEYLKALRYYESRLDSGDTSVEVVMPLIETYREIGQTDRAVKALEQYVQRHPSDVEALVMLVKLCDQAMLPGKRLRHMAALQAVAPSRENAEGLVRLYEHEQLYTRQLALVRHGGTAAEGISAAGLVRILAGAGRYAEAVAAALRADAADPAALDTNSRYTVFRLLVDMHRTSEAVQLSRRWLEGPGSSAPRPAVFAEWLLYRGFPNEALALIRSSRSDLVNADEDVRGAYVNALRATGKTDELRAFWRRRLAVDGLGDDEETTILYGLLDIGDRDQALALLRKRAVGRRGDWIVSYVETAAKFNRETDLQKFLEDEFARAGASPADLQHVSSIVLNASATSAAAVLAARAEQDPQTWANLYVEALKRSGRSRELLAYEDKIIAGGKLDKSTRDQWLHRLKDEGGLARAVPHIRRVAAEDGGAWRNVYVSTLRKLGRTQELRSYITSAVNDSRLTADERRWLAEEMLHEGLKKDAMPVFMKLAEGSPAGSSKVRELMFLWGPRLDATALAWCERQLAGAAPSEQEGWLRLLLDMKAAGRVAAWFEAQSDAAVRQVPRLLYIESLYATNQRQKLTAAIGDALDDPPDPTSIRRYALLADAIGDIRLTERAWSALLVVAPDDEKARRGRGMIRFAQRRHADAEADLRWYVRRQPTDYEAHYVLAEVLTNLARPHEAESHYRDALSLIGGLPEKPYAARLAEAMCYHRLGDEEQAVAAFRWMMKAYPNQRGLRADFASALLENNATAMAKHVLGMP